MKNNTKTLLIILVVILAVWVFAQTLASAVFYAPPDEIPLSHASQNYTEGQEAYSAPPPQELRIPKIAVDADVQYVGITRKGNISVPNNFKDVGWFKYGIVPGEKGTAIIAGHVDNGFALPGVFSELHKLSTGDDIYIETTDGETIHFTVTGMETYDFTAPTDNIFSPDDDAYLVLITCSGKWLEKYRTHEKRLVVTAKRVSR